MTETTETPGPFGFGNHDAGRNNCIVDDRQVGWILLFPYDSRGADLDATQRAELVDLLNKGTHFDMLVKELEAISCMTSLYAVQCAARTALAKAKGEPHAG